MEPVSEDRSTQGACLLWCGLSRRLLWTDVAAATLWTHDPASGRTRSWPMPEPLSCFALTGSDDRLLLGLASGLAFFRFSTGRIQRIRTDAGVPSARIVDGRCDRQGRFVIAISGDGLYRLNLDLSLERLPIDSAAGAHGICFSPDGRRMYFADAASDEIRFAHYNPCSGEVGAVRNFLAAGAAPGEANGATVDAEGCLWSARRGAGQLMRFAPDGRLERTIEVDASQPGCPAFGGPALSTLYVIMEGGLFQRALELRGLPEPRFLH